MKIDPPYSAGPDQRCEWGCALLALIAHRVDRQDTVPRRFGDDVPQLILHTDDEPAAVDRVTSRV